MALQINRLYS